MLQYMVSKFTECTLLFLTMLVMVGGGGGGGGEDLNLSVSQIKENLVAICHSLACNCDC